MKHKKLKIIGAILITIMIIILSIFFIKIKPIIKKAQIKAFTEEGQISETTFLKAGNSVIYDKNDKVIAEYTCNNYEYKDISKISPWVQQGFIAIEDKDFLKHKGVSLKALARVGVQFIKNKGRFTQGGSTITQQLVKNVFLTQEKTLDRKITEMYLAPKIEKKFSKSKILEFYLNNIYFGHGCYGIESASQYYFSKSANKLSLDEATILCAIPNNPTLYDPVKKPNNTIKRKNLILNAMLEQKMINKSDYTKSKQSNINLNIKKPKKNEENYITSFAIDCAVKSLMEKDNFKFQYSFKNLKEKEEYVKRYKKAYSFYDQKIRSGGYKIYTSIDMKKQKELQKSIDTGLQNFTEKDQSSNRYLMQGAGVCIDNQSGYVIAIVGGRGEKDIFNRGFLAYRQPGSSIKPLIAYTPAFEKGYHPMSLITDKHIPNGPKNAENCFFGPVTLRWATEMSLNTIPYQLLINLKPKYCLSFLEKMRYSEIYPEDKNPIAALGGFTKGVTPLEQAAGFYTLANNGCYTPPTCIKKIEYIKETIYKNSNKKEKVYSSESAYMMTDILKGVINSEHGTGRKQKINGQIAAGKTGTTDNCKDGWFCGYSAYYTTVIWCGYDNPKSIDGLYGATYPGRIWQNFMSKIHSGLPSKDFTRPSGIIEKYIDGLGNPTNVNTGRKDIFSSYLLEKQKEEQERKNRELEAEKQAEWEKNEPIRQKNAEDLVIKYENAHYINKELLDKIDTLYNKSLAAIKIIDSVNIKNELEIRLQAHYETILPERKELIKLIEKQTNEQIQHAEEMTRKKIEAEERAKYEAQKEVKIQLQLEEEAENAVKELESYLNNKEFEKISPKIQETLNKINKIKNKKIRENLINRLEIIKNYKN